MRRLIFENFPWIAPWQAISSAGREAYEHELSLEVAPGHPLYRVPVSAIGRVCNGDDILFQLEGHAYELAVVHLTFTGRPEPNEKWPAVMFFNNVDEWIMRGMLVDAARYEVDEAA